MTAHSGRRLNCFIVQLDCTGCCHLQIAGNECRFRREDNNKGHPMSGEAPEYLTTRELADLLRIKERKVYDMAAAGEVPCSRAMGKLLFPRAEVEAWLAASASGPRVPVPRRSARR
jgi:excisionase family DNA binding protein